MGTLLVSQHPAVQPAQAEPGDACAGRVWTDGYYHDNGLEYVWVPGHCEPASAAWQWAQ